MDAECAARKGTLPVSAPKRERKSASDATRLDIASQTVQKKVRRMGLTGVTVYQQPNKMACDWSHNFCLNTYGRNLTFCSHLQHGIVQCTFCIRELSMLQVANSVYLFNVSVYKV